MPKRTTYSVNTTQFQRSTDLEAFTEEGAVVQPISVDDLTISIAEDPQKPAETTPVPPGANYPFTSAGRKLVLVQYESFTDLYSIDVKYAFEVNPSPGGESDNGGGGIGWEFWEP